MGELLHELMKGGIIRGPLANPTPVADMYMHLISPSTENAHFANHLT